MLWWMSSEMCLNDLIRSKGYKGIRNWPGLPYIKKVNNTLSESPHHHHIPPAFKQHNDRRCLSRKNWQSQVFLKHTQLNLISRHEISLDKLESYLRTMLLTLCLLCSWKLPFQEHHVLSSIRGISLSRLSQKFFAEAWMIMVCLKVDRRVNTMYLHHSQLQ